MTYKIKKEITLRNTDDFVSNFNEQTEPFFEFETKSFSNRFTEFPGTSTGINFKCLIINNNNDNKQQQQQQQQQQ